MAVMLSLKAPGVTLPLFELCVSCWSEGAKVERVGSDRVMWCDCDMILTIGKEVDKGILMMYKARIFNFGGQVLRCCEEESALGWHFE